MATEAKEGFILGGQVTPANRADTLELEKVADELDLLKTRSYLWTRAITAARIGRC